MGPAKNVLVVGSEPWLPPEFVLQLGEHCLPPLVQLNSWRVHSVVGSYCHGMSWQTMWGGEEWTQAQERKQEKWMFNRKQAFIVGAQTN